MFPSAGQRLLRSTLSRSGGYAYIFNGLRHAGGGGGIAVAFEADVVGCRCSRGGKGQAVAVANAGGEGSIGVPLCRGIGAECSACIAKDDVAISRTEVVAVH